MEKSITYKATAFKRSTTHYLKKREECEWLKINDGEWETVNKISQCYLPNFSIIRFNSKDLIFSATAAFLSNCNEEDVFELMIRLLEIIKWKKICEEYDYL